MVDYQDLGELAQQFGSVKAVVDYQDLGEQFGWVEEVDLVPWVKKWIC